LVASALLGGGGYAEYCVIHQDVAMHVRLHARNEASLVLCAWMADR
jgi:D-arabinose 1-dehydrogenase-like Zn-dependent alcohol dehydrogenase